MKAKRKGDSIMKAKRKDDGRSSRTIVDVLQGRIEEVGHLPEPQRTHVLAWFDHLKNNHIPLRSIGEVDDKKLRPKDDFPGGPVAWFAALSDITGSPNPELSLTILMEVLQSAGIPLSAIAATMMEISPRDSTELMLATQLIALHHQAMQMMGRTVMEGQTVIGVNDNISRADKLLRAFRETLGALQKYRGKGTQQKVIVEHVHVHHGGKAIVGAVTQTGGEGGIGEKGRTTSNTPFLESGKLGIALEFPVREALLCENEDQAGGLHGTGHEERPM